MASAISHAQFGSGFRNRDNEDVASLIGSGLLVLVMLSAVGAIVAFTLLPYAVDAFVTIPGLRQDANHSFMLLALIVPTAIISGGLTGILGGQASL